MKITSEIRTRTGPAWHNPDMLRFTSVPGVIDMTYVRGARSRGDLDLVIEIPHGATRTDDYARLARELTSPLPDQLVDFFHVNTDAGAPELAEAVARRFVDAEPTRTVGLLRCLIPRTFIDCNRRIDAAPEEFRAGKVTPGLMPWITTDADRALLRSRYDAYVGAVDGALTGLAPNGALLMLHSYAPRSVDVEVDLDIVANLRRAYQPGVASTWPMRPELDVIGRDADGVSHAPAAVVAALRAGVAPLTVADSATYPLHPSTLAHARVLQRPGRALCLEVRRDLVADPFEPFAEMRIGATKVAALAGPLATALRAWW
jgi:hypothetical protein